MTESASSVYSDRDESGRFFGIGPNSAALRRGMSTLAVGEAATKSALSWIWRWGWASPSIVDYLTLDPGRRGKAARLIERKVLKVHTPGVWAPDAPRKILTLTDYGKDELCRLDTDLDVTARHEVKWGQIRHDHIVQHLVAETLVRARTQELDFSYMSTPELTHAAAQAKEKIGRIPDALLGSTALEVELSTKDEGELHRTVRGLCEAYAQRLISTVWVVSTHASALKAYATLMRPGMRVRVYRRTTARTWSMSGTAELKEVPRLRLSHLKDTKTDYMWSMPGHSIYPGLLKWQPPPLPPVQAQRDLLDEREREPEPDPDEYDYYEPQVKSPFGRQ